MDIPDSPVADPGSIRMDLSQDGPTLVNQAWDAHRGYWNTGAMIQALNLGILTAAINTIR